MNMEVKFIIGNSLKRPTIFATTLVAVYSPNFAHKTSEPNNKLFPSTTDLHRSDRYLMFSSLAVRIMKLSIGR